MGLAVSDLLSPFILALISRHTEENHLSLSSQRQIGIQRTPPGWNNREEDGQGDQDGSLQGNVDNVVIW
jgi:hypothetical protein